MATKKPGVKYKKPSIEPELLEGIARMYAEHMRAKEAARLEIFNRAWHSLSNSDDDTSKRVALAVAYLEGGSK